MKNNSLLLSLGALVVASSILVSVMFLADPTESVGQMSDTLAYKTVTSSNASNTASYVIRGGSGVLGSITVGSSSAAAIRIYDGTATSTGTLIGTLKASVAEQTFLFNTAVVNGIALDVPSTHNGVYTVNYR